MLELHADFRRYFSRNSFVYDSWALDFGYHPFQTEHIVDGLCRHLTWESRSLEELEQKWETQWALNVLKPMSVTVLNYFWPAWQSVLVMHRGLFRHLEFLSQVGCDSPCLSLGFFITKSVMWIVCRSKHTVSSTFAWWTLARSSCCHEILTQFSFSSYTSQYTCVLDCWLFICTKPFCY